MRLPILLASLSVLLFHACLLAGANRQTDPSGWGDSETCSGCGFSLIVDPAVAVGVTLHESAHCISGLLRPHQWPTAKWDFSIHGELMVKKQKMTGNVWFEGFLGFNGLKSGYPTNQAGGFSIQDYGCPNGVRATVDCLPSACSNGVREVIGLVMDPPGTVAPGFGHDGEQHGGDGGGGH